ncbi:MAG TPA: hypothetical protein PK595_09540 [Bacteroidota bacterium]|nr:hypothetical protein [Bacteroidota bacterium]
MYSNTVLQIVSTQIMHYKLAQTVASIRSSSYLATDFLTATETTGLKIRFGQ